MCINLLVPASIAECIKVSKYDLPSPFRGVNVRHDVQCVDVKCGCQCGCVECKKANVKSTLNMRNSPEVCVVSVYQHVVYIENSTKTFASG